MSSPATPPSPAAPLAAAPRPLLPTDPTALFRLAAEHLGGARQLWQFLGCSRATAYNLLSGRKRWSAKYLQKVLALLGEHPVVLVNYATRYATHGAPEGLPDQWRAIPAQTLVLRYDGAFRVENNALWPLVAEGQYVLYRNVRPEELSPGDIVVVKLRTGETLVRAWYPAGERRGEVFLAALYRGPREFRQDFFRPFPLKDLSEFRKVVGVWMG